MKKVLITGIDSFTGNHLSSHLQNCGYDIYGTSLNNESEKKFKCDITKKDDIFKVLETIEPHYIIHLSGISFAAHQNNEEFYKVNTIGTLNMLDSVIERDLSPSKIVLASSATVYGNQGKEILDESLCPMPANHYGASKYAMECLSKNYFDKLNIIITRPFNYTGIGQAEYFLIPKIVSHYKQKKDIIELGNLDVSREFNDVNYVCKVYKKLLECDKKSEIVNICSNKAIKLLYIIEMMNKVAGYKIEVKVNAEFLRKDEIKTLTGSTKKLNDIIGSISQNTLSKLLEEMYND